VKAGAPASGPHNLQIFLEAAGGHDLDSLKAYFAGGLLEGARTRLAGHYFQEFRASRLWAAHGTYLMKLHERLRGFILADYAIFESLDSAGWTGFGAGLRVSAYRGIPVKILYGHAPRAERPGGGPGREILLTLAVVF
jgi:hypothetical protein